VIDLPRRLDELGAELVFPPTPDLAPAVLPRLVRRRRRGRRVLVAALAVLALLGAVLAASPRARSAVLDWLGIGGVQIVEVDELPVVPVREQPVLGERVSLAEARRRVAFAVQLLPESAGTPDEVYLRGNPTGGAVTLVYGSPGRPRLLLSQWRGGTYEPVLLKIVGPGTEHEVVTVDGGPGIWLRGAPHVVYSHSSDGHEFEERLYLAGNVLVWERGALALRLEADIDMEEALELAESLE
jgi:hypothetical protein